MSKLTRLFIDVVNENVDAIPRRLADLGVRYPKEREEEFIAELRELFYRYYGARLAEIDPIQVIREAFALIYSMNLQLPTRFVLLDKAIATLGSVGVELYPDFNVFEVAKPYARDLMVERFTPRRMAMRRRRRRASSPRIARELPYQVHDILEEVRDGQIEVGFVHKGLDEFMHKLDVVFNRLVVAVDRRRRADRLDPDRDPRHRRAADPRRPLPLGDRLRPLGRARRLAPLGRAPLRPALASRCSRARLRSSEACAAAADHGCREPCAAPVRGSASRR